MKSNKKALFCLPDSIQLIFLGANQAEAEDSIETLLKSFVTIVIKRAIL